MPYPENSIGPDAITYGRTLTMQEFGQLLEVIKEKHAFGKCFEPGCKHIKYITPQIDTRDWQVFRLTLGGFAKEDLVFDFRDSADNMIDRVNAWLAGPN